MIEFRAECGHTVRARNEDAGKIVNCAYCGRRTLVPSEENDGIESLLAETLDESRDRLGDLEAGESRWRKGRAAAPLRIAWTAVFLVLVLSVLLLTARGVFRAVMGPETGPQPGPVGSESPAVSTQQTPVERAPVPEEPPRPPRPRNALGNLDLMKSGLVVFSIPARLEVYVQRLPLQGGEELSVEDLKGVTSASDRLLVELEPGRYRVSIAARVRNPDLMDLEGYAGQVRQAIARTGEVYAAEDYFLEDGATQWRLERLGGQESLIKVFELELGREWRPICALFVPRETDSRGLLEFVSGEPKMEFRFQERRAEQELGFWGVVESDYGPVKAALRRIGKAVMHDPKTGRIRVFQVWPDESVVGTEMQGEQLPPEP